MNWDEVERRRYRRRSCRAQIKGHDKDLFVMDLSPEGVRLMGDFKPSTDSLELRLELSGVIHKTEGQVAWLRPVGDDGHYQIGIHFNQLVPSEPAIPEGPCVPKEPRGALRSLSADELKRLKILAAIGGLLNESDRVDDLLEKMMESLLHHLSAERALLLTPTRGAFQITKHAGTQEPAFSRRVAEQVAQSGKPLLSLDATDDIRLEDSQSIKLLGTRSILCVPVVARDQCLGLIYLDNSITNAFSEPELHLASIVADMAAAAIDRAHFVDNLSQSERALSAAHEELHSLVELNSDGILVVDEERRVAFANPASLQFFEGDLSMIASLDFSAGSLPELEIRRLDGTQGWALIKTEKTRWDDRDALLVTVRDVTVARQQEIELRHSQKMQAIGRLAGGVAHDFNNLLTAILGSCELLEVAGPQDRIELEAIKDCAKRAATLTEQLLAFSKKGGKPPVPMRLDLSVRRLQRMLIRVLGEDVSVKFAGGDEKLWIRADEDEVDQIVLNLAVNARDALDSGGCIEFELRTEGRFAVLEVRDDGCGMEDAVKERIFEPFFTTKTHGTGLGLSTVYGIVESYGGRIQIESAPGRGACFALFLPLVEPLREAADGATGPQLAPGKGHIVVVEDEHSVRHLIVRVLERAGYRVTAFERAENALELDVQEFDLLLSDIMLPGMNGLELAKALVAKRPSLRVLLMSGYSEGILDSRGGSPEDFPFMAKPFQLSCLTEKLAELMAENDSSVAD